MDGARGPLWVKIIKDYYLPLQMKSFGSKLLSIFMLGLKSAILAIQKNTLESRILFNSKIAEIFSTVLMAKSDQRQDSFEFL